MKKTLFDRTIRGVRVRIIRWRSATFYIGRNIPGDNQEWCLEIGRYSLWIDL